MPIPPELPVGYFIDDPEYGTARISPGADYLALIAPFEDRESLVVLRLADLHPMSRTAFGSREGILNVHWVRNDRLLIEPSQDDAFNYSRASTGELVGIDADGSRRQLLYGYRAGQMSTSTHMKVRGDEYASAELLHTLQNEEGIDEVLIATHPWRVNGFTAVHRMNIYTGKLRDVDTAPNPNSQVIVDRGGRLVFTYGRAGNDTAQLYRRKPEGGWTLVVQTEPGQDLPLVPLRDTADPNIWHVLDRSEAITGLAQVDIRTLATPAAGTSASPTKVLFRHEHADVEEALYSLDDGPLWGVRYEQHFPEYFYLDAKQPIAALHRALQLQLQLQADVLFTSFSADGRKAIAFVSSDRKPGEFFLVDFISREVRALLKSRPRLNGAALAEMQPLRLKARDGMPLNSYITFPVGRPRTGLPMVVLPHGGPYGIRDRLRFDPEVQLLANRGYAVLQVNFRGSDGFGSDFRTAGAREWGARMQDDISDATRWAIAKGLADPKRICIFGASFGAYSALMGVVREPDLYRCAIGYAGVYDLPLMYNSGDVPRMQNGRAYLEAALGNDPAQLVARSPVAQAGRVHADVLLIHGRLDRRAPIEHARRMRSALQDAGRQVAWIEEDQEGHGFLNQARRRAMYEQVLAFLARNIGAGKQSTAAAQ